ncbi:MAG: FkbM family methyltransferase [Hydrotalea sp.]|nr:FkbM family methyltransferase [Hydrotalea sp.]
MYKALANFKTVFFYRLKRKLDFFRRNSKRDELILPAKRFQTAFIDYKGKKLKIVDIASFKFINNEIFNLEIYKFITNNPKPYIIDAGANIGLGIIYFKQLYPNAEIVAFEPDPNVFDALNFNIRSFNLDNVLPFKKALWNTETVLEFLADGADGGRVDFEKVEKDKIVVEAVSLRKFLLRKVDLLKIDIEGAETIVLLDCKDLLNSVERVFIEFHSFVNRPQDLNIILNILKDAGFRYNIQHIGTFSKQPFVEINEYMGMDLQLNIFAFKK